jgi:hypothetical protein
MKFIFLQFEIEIWMKKMIFSIKKFTMAILVTGAGWMCGACGEDRTPEFVEKTERCQWIHDVMSEWYLWCDEMPQLSDALYFGNPETFFKKLIACSNAETFTPALITINLSNNNSSLIKLSSLRFNIQLSVSTA